MNTVFFKYFFKYIFKSRTRQGVLALAILGLLLSSFSLIVLQAVMGGLQKGVIDRSKEVYSTGFIDLRDGEFADASRILKEKNIQFTCEYELEVLLKNDTRVLPVILHGVDSNCTRPDFLEGKDLSGINLGSVAARKLNIYFNDKVRIISPAHTDYLLMEIPRQVSSEFTDVVITGLDEVDQGHAWVDIKTVQNLARERVVNKLLFYNSEDFIKAKEALGGMNLNIKAWEEVHRSLAWALKLETSVMITLFFAMSLLVAICITSGYMIFFDKTKGDLISFWILGKSRKKIFRLLFLFTQIMNVSFSLIGLAAGLLVLKLLESKNLNFIPEFFIDQSLPVEIDLNKIVIAFFIPYLIASIFSYFTYRLFQSENGSFLKNIRSVS